MIALTETKKDENNPPLKVCLAPGNRSGQPDFYRRLHVKQAMDEELKTFTEQYAAALQSYFAQGQEANLDWPSKLGRKAMAKGVDVLKLTTVHQLVMRKFVEKNFPATSPTAMAKGDIFFLEVISAFEATRHGVLAANEKLLQMNQILAKRNQELTGINRSLQNEVGERKRTEKALRESEEHFRLLFSEARQMQENLRNLSCKVLHAQEEERKRISRELHDEVGQALTAINVDLTALRKTHGLSDSTLDRKLVDAQRLLEETMQAVHQFSRELRPAMLDDLGLVPALRAYVKAFAERTSLRACFGACNRAEKLGNEQKIVLYRVAQESLTNVAKHAHATEVAIKLRNVQNGISLEIKDNGKAFQVDKQMRGRRKKRLGLLGIQERVRLVHGNFAVDSQPGKGTTVRVQIPLNFDK